VARQLPRVVAEEKIQLVIANVENAAGGFGITPQLALDLFKMGIEVMTTGNHVWDRREIYDYINSEPRLLRPANYPPGAPGSGLYIVRAGNGVECAVINLQGRTHMLPIDCPFRKADEILAGLPETVKVRFVDFHAEATSEKAAMGWHLDGRVSAVIGTHTHIPTADARLLPGGTAFQTDAGMTGPYDSIIGVERDPVLRKFMNGLPVRMEAATERPEFRAVVVAVETATGRATAIRPILYR
jgi:metallophosphoesterase (TIGR00282 family)